MKLDGFTNIAVSLMTQILRVLYHILWGGFSICSQTDGWMIAYIYSLLTVWVSNDHLSSQFYPELPVFMLKTAHVIAWCLQVSCSPLSLAVPAPGCCRRDGPWRVPGGDRSCLCPATCVSANPQSQRTRHQTVKGSSLNKKAPWSCGELCCWTQQLTWSGRGKGFIHWGRKNGQNS